MYAAKNNYILCVENILKLPEVNVKWKDNVENKKIKFFKTILGG